MQEKDERDSARYIGVSQLAPPRRRRRGDAEKKRRKRINKCLEDLEKIVPEVRRRRLVAKVDKAEILEMTVEFVRQATRREHVTGPLTPTPILPQPDVTCKALGVTRRHHDLGSSRMNGSCTECESRVAMIHSTARPMLGVPRVVSSCVSCHWPDYAPVRTMPRRAFGPYK